MTNHAVACVFWRSFHRENGGSDDDCERLWVEIKELDDSINSPYLLRSVCLSVYLSVYYWLRVWGGRITRGAVIDDVTWVGDDVINGSQRGVDLTTQQQRDQCKWRHRSRDRKKNADADDRSC